MRQDTEEQRQSAELGTPRVARALLNGATRIVSTLAVVGVALIFVVLLVVPRVTDGAALTVLTGSMEPEIAVGSVVMVRPVDPATLGPGDIATYQARPGSQVFITHRVVSVDDSTTPATFVFKGDANRGEDPDPVPATAIRGEVWFAVPYLGAARDSIQDSSRLGLLMMVALTAYAAAQLLSHARDRRRRVPSRS